MKTFKLFPRLAIGAIAMAGLLSSGLATAQTCSGTTCDLGGHQRFQIGAGLPIPITLNPAQTGAALQVNGGIQAIPGATVMQTTAMATARRLTVPPGAFVDVVPQVQIPVFAFNPNVLAVSTNLVLSNPRPGSPSVLSAFGRTGDAIVTWCPGSTVPAGPGSLANTFVGGCASAGATTTRNGGPVLSDNGLVRFTATKNQFGGTQSGLTTGTAQVFFNAGGLTFGALNNNGGCQFATNVACRVAVSQATPNTSAANAGPFGKTAPNPADINPTGIWGINAGPFGTVLTLVAPLSTMGGIVPIGGGPPIPFQGQAATSFGFPATTGMLTISVPGAFGSPEIFVRTGNDTRNANGSGIVMLVSGTLSNRSLSGPNANRGWSVLEIPEPGVLAAGSSALAMLAGCHWLIRRRRQG